LAAGEDAPRPTHCWSRPRAGKAGSRPLNSAVEDVEIFNLEAIVLIADGTGEVPGR
jgi:hypothetical protein